MLLSRKNVIIIYGVYGVIVAQMPVEHLVSGQNRIDTLQKYVVEEDLLR